MASEVQEEAHLLAGIRTQDSFEGGRHWEGGGNRGAGTLLTLREFTEPRTLTTPASFCAKKKLLRCHFFHHKAKMGINV